MPKDLWQRARNKDFGKTPPFLPIGETWEDEFLAGLRANHEMAPEVKRRLREEMAEERGLERKARTDAANGELRLISRRGTRVAKRQPCRRCGKTYDTLWRYTESTRGTVLLCAFCKHIAR